MTTRTYCASENFDRPDSLQGHAVRHRVHVGADAADPLQKSDGLRDILALGKPLDAADIEADLEGGGTNFGPVRQG